MKCRGKLKWYPENLFVPEKSRDGFTAQIRDLLLKYGAKKLSEVDPASYKALVADAEVLRNA